MATDGGRRLRRTLAAIVVAVTALATTAVNSGAAVTIDRDAEAAAARAAGHRGEYERARSAWRALLVRDPNDVEARAGLVDVLTWERRFDEAAAEIDVGLALNPNAPELLARRARLSWFRGDGASAHDDIARAEAARPRDGDLRAIGDRIWRGEARLILRNDFFPRDWADQPTAELQIKQRVGRFLLGARTEQTKRYANAFGGRGYAALYAASVDYTIAIGWIAGVEAGFGAPSRALPEALGRAYLWFPIVGRVDGYASYTYATWSNGTRLHMVNPSIGVQVHGMLRLDARAWFGRLAIDNTNDIAAAYGGYALFTPSTRFAIDALYVYGRQLDRIPDTARLASLNAHVLSSSVDLRLARAFGVRPRYQLEIRRLPSNQTLTIHSAELGLYVRW